MGKSIGDFNMIDFSLQVSGIYKLTNLVNQKIYVGSAQRIGRRWYSHFKYPQFSNCTKLRNAVIKYGEEAFEAEVIEVVENFDQLIDREQYYLDLLHPFGECGYNIRTVAGSNIGIKRSDEEKRKMSERTRGKYNPMWGRTQSDDTKTKISTKLTGIKRTPEQKSKMGKHLCTPVVAYNKDNTIFKQYPSITAAVMDVNGDTTALWKCLNNYKNFNTHKGLIWKYDHPSVDILSTIPNDL